jgi:small subunit ribosomal protein S4
MGDPKKLRKQYSTPNHPWNETAIKEERVLKKEYGLRIKKEIMIANSFLSKYKAIAKKLIANKTAQGEKEAAQVLGKLEKLGVLAPGSNLNQILSLEVRDALNRRLQSIVFRKGFARSMRQARQFIVHRHVRIGEKEITFPGYMTSLEEEADVTFTPSSALASEDHPERVNEAKEVKEEVEKIKATVRDAKDDNVEVVVDKKAEDAAPESETVEAKEKTIKGEDITEEVNKE